MQRIPTHAWWCFFGVVLGSSSAGCGVTSEPAVLPLDTATLELVVADFVIGTDTPVFEQYNAGNYPDIAAGDDQRLAVFEDGGRIRGVRFDETGAVLDREWLDFGVDGRVQLYPAVAHGDDRYLVVWSETDDTTPGSRIYGQVVPRTGAIQGQPKLLVESGFEARAGWLGSAFVLAWVDNGVHLARVDGEGNLIAGSTKDVSAPNVTSLTRPLIATDGTLGVVAYSDSDGARRNVRLARFDAQGTVLDPGGIVLNPTLEGTGEAGEYTVATTRTHGLVAFRSGSSIKASIVTAEGTLEIKEFDIISEPTIGGPSAAADGTNFVVVWACDATAGRDLCAKGITAKGTVDNSVQPLGVKDGYASQSRMLALTFGNGAYALAYEGAEGTFGHQFSPTFEPINGPLPLSALPNKQNLPFTSWNGENYVVSFYDERAEGMQSRAVRISKQGIVLDPDGIEVSPPEHLAFSSASASNSSGTTAFVFTSSEQSSAYVRTMNTQASLSDLVLLSDGNPQDVSVVSNGTTFMMAYARSAEPNSASTIYVRPLTEMGVPQGQPVPVVPDVPRPRFTIVPQGENYLLAYSGQTLETGAPVSGKVRRVSASGEILAEFAPPNEGNPLYTAASNPDGTVIFGWNDRATELKFRLLKGDTWSETTALTTQPSEEEPAFAWDGQRFVSVWVERRKALWTRTVEPDGALGNESVAVLGDHTSPKLTLGPGPELLLTSVNWEIFSRSRRVQSRLVAAEGVNLPNPNEGDATDTLEPSSQDSNGGAHNTSTTGSPESTTATSPNAPPPSATSGADSTSNTSAQNETTSTTSTTGLSDPTQVASSSNIKRSPGGCSLSTASSEPSRPQWLVAAFAAGLVYTRRRRAALLR